MVRKPEKPSHFQECFGSPGISDILLSSLSFVSVKGAQHSGAPMQRQFSENICSEDYLRSRIFGTFLVRFLACLLLLRFLNI